MKVFRDSAVTNLSEFFWRFKELNVRSNAELDRLVETAQKAVRGVGPQALRNDQSLRQRLAGQLTVVANSLDAMMVDKPRRRILRPMHGPAPASDTPAGEPSSTTQHEPAEAVA